MSLKNVTLYRQPFSIYVFPVEQKVLPTLVYRGSHVLDAGCGSGRLLPFLCSLDAEVVVGVDLNDRAIFKAKKLCESLNLSNVLLLKGDILDLPFCDEMFDIVVASFNVLDFLYPPDTRKLAIIELSRVLKKGGVFFFSSHNPVGTLFSPRGLFHKKSLSWRWRYFRTKQYRERYFKDPNGLLLYQAIPEEIQTEVEQCGFRLLQAYTRSGKAFSLLVNLLSAWPFYVAQKA